MGTRDSRCWEESDWDTQQAAEAGGPPWVRACAHGRRAGRKKEATWSRAAEAPSAAQ